MPSLTTENCDVKATLQQEKSLLKKRMNTPMNNSTSIYNKKLNNFSSLLIKENIGITQPASFTQYHNHHHHNHHHNRVRSLSTLDCYTLKNEIVKLNTKSSVSKK